MVATSLSPLKAGTRSSCRRNEPLQPKADQPLAEPLCPNRTQPLSLHSTSSAQQVGVGWIVNCLVSVLNLEGSLSLTPSGLGCAGLRIGPRLSLLPRQGLPQGARLEAADAGTWRLRAGPERGSEHPKGSVRAALKAQAYRLRPEGLPPAEMQHQ